MSWARDFVTSLGRTPSRAASERALEAAERHLGVRLPASLRTFYACTDGLQIGELSGLVLLSVRELLEHAGGLDAWGIPRREFGYLPVAWCPLSTDRLCVAACDALEARVVWVPHDAGPRVAFPDLQHMLAAITDAHRNVVSMGAGSVGRAGLFAGLRRRISSIAGADDDAPHWDLHSLPHWYQRHTVHTPDDIACATRLLERYEPRLAQPRDVIARHGVGFAIDLLDETCVPTLDRLLARFDPSWRALARLTSLRSPEAVAVVARYRNEQIEVGRHLVDVARAHGLDASFDPPLEDARGGHLQVGAKGFKLAYWHAQRNEPDLEQRFLAACAKKPRQ